MRRAPSQEVSWVRDQKVVVLLSRQLRRPTSPLRDSPSFFDSNNYLACLLSTVASSIAQQHPVSAAVHPHHRIDEDFINRSLLDQIDTEADADPVFSSDSEAAGASGGGRLDSGHNFGSSSQSSVESQDLVYPYAMQTQSHPPMRSGSPSGQRASLGFVPHDDHFVHTPQQSLYGNAGMESSNDFAPFSEGDPQQSAGPFEAGSFRNNSMFGSFFPPRTRPSVAGPSYDPNAAYSQFNGMSIGDVFGAHQPLQSMSQQQQQQQQQSNGIRSYDFSNEGQTMKPNGKPIFANMDPFNTGAGTASSSLLHSHQLNQLNNKSAQIQQQQQQQQQHLHGFVSQSFANGLLQTQQQSHSQVPFGPQLAPNNGAMGGGGLSLSNGMGTVSVTTQQEEISTIFVVGFPEDMQEREFQNMFTFSSGFEAATLKIPNKDSTAYGTNAPSTANGVNSTGRGVFQLGYPFNGPNDPYNLLTVNQGGVVVDSRDGTTASWPSSDPNDLSGGLNSNSMNAQGPNPGPPRKQIIGFAKFRTRAEALAARDLLQGRRVDIEKGAVLKAEMAKKNLHTKRGVGPLGAPLSVSVGGAGVGSGGMGGVGNAMNGVSSLSLGSIAEGLSGMTGMLSPVSGPGPETLSARERELGPLGPMGLGGLARRDRMETQEEERENRRRRDFGSVSAISNGLNALSILGSRGPRERLEEDEREREKRRKEKEVERNGRLRAGNQAAYDAFHSVTVPSRNSSLTTTALGSGVLSPSESIGGYPFPGSQMFSPQESASGHGSDGWPTGPSQGMRRLGNFGMSNLSRPVPFGITTNTNNVHTSSSLESSPTELNADPASLSSRSGNSDKALSQESDMFSPPSDMALASHPSMSSVSSLGSRSRPYSPTNDTAMSSSGFLPPLPEQQHHSGQDQGQSLPAVPSSSSSSVSETRSSSSVDEDVSRTVGNIDVNSQQGTISPQLPSPNSGASSGTGSRTNASDQNPPINTLYVGNLPTSPIPGNQPNFLEESLRSLFARCAGYRKLCFRQKSNGPMCFVEFEDVSYATKALNELYGHNLNGLVKGGIRLSYSKNPLGVRTPTNVANGSGLQQGLQTFGPGSFSSLQEAFSRQSNAGILSIDMSSIRGPRRDANEVTSPSHYFASSPPPPRFFSPPPSTGFGFTGQTSAPGLARSNSQSYTSTFSPFGSSTPPDMTTQAAATSESADPFQSNNNLSTAQSLEATRAG
ncbi:hypothetical protein M0805_005768 [Coniferiporia weirii]|nr:hypothetical protein M0805_005768 [Coniferiporia weirii]